MTVHRRQFLKFAGAAVAAPAFAQAPQVTLKMHHFLPPVSNVHTRLLKSWAMKVETDSDFRLKIDIFPSMQLGGTPSQLYDQARDGDGRHHLDAAGFDAGPFPENRGVRSSLHLRPSRRCVRQGGAGIL